MSQRHGDPGGDAVRPAVPDQGGRRDHGNAVTDDHVAGPRGDDEHGEAARQLVHHRTDRLVRRADARDRPTPTGTASSSRPSCWATPSTARCSSASTSPATLTDLEDCLDDGLCSESESLQYLSPDGKKLSASVRGVEAGGGSAELRRHTRRGQPDVVRRQRVRAGRRHGRGHLPVAFRGEPLHADRACSWTSPLASARHTAIRSPARRSPTPGRTRAAFNGRAHGDRLRGPDGDDHVRGAGAERAATDLAVRS